MASRTDTTRIVRDELGRKTYDTWLTEVLVDFGDYTFTRHELNEIGVGMHFRAARNLHNAAKRMRWSLADIYRMGLKSFHNTPDTRIGPTTLIVTAYCIAAANDSWDVLRWMEHQARTIRGGVNQAKTRRA